MYIKSPDTAKRQNRCQMEMVWMVSKSKRPKPDTFSWYKILMDDKFLDVCQSNKARSIE